MRGPLLVGPIGSAASLDRVAALVRDKAPAIVLSSVWLASALAQAHEVLLLCEPEAQRQAKRALKRASSAGQKLSVVVAGETLPLPTGSAGAFLVEGLADTEEEDAISFLLDLGHSLAPEGRVVALDGTKDPAVEARVAGFFLAAGLRRIGQERPKEGALLTVADAPLPEVLAARAEPT